VMARASTPSRRRPSTVSSSCSIATTASRSSLSSTDVFRLARLRARWRPGCSRSR
jgi:hypothetical protein